MTTHTIQFRPTGWQGYAHSSQATIVRNGTALTVTGSLKLDEVELSAYLDGNGCSIRVDTAMARSVAAELLAAADAVDAAQGRA